MLHSYPLAHESLSEPESFDVVKTAFEEVDTKLKIKKPCEYTFSRGIVFRVVPRLPICTPLLPSPRPPLPPAAPPLLHHPSAVYYDILIHPRLLGESS